jgi:cystathionine gamma-synthase/methionine-gamma-lyase
MSNEETNRGAQQPSLATRAAHAGLSPDLSGTQPANVPIFASSTFLSETAGDLDAVLGGTQPGYVYGRYGNPTLTALESVMAGLEGAAATVSFSSGMAALHAALLLCELESGSVVLAGSDLYGSSHTLLNTMLGPFGVEARFVDTTDLAAVEAALAQTPRPAAVLFEAMSNPLLKVSDVPAICALARAAGARTIVDSTFTPPPLLQPIAHGADIVVHSATKYLSGHGDVFGGFVSVADAAHARPLREISKLAGAILGPFEAYLIVRGIKTLALRVRQQCANAAALADWLAGHPAVGRVHYPGLPAHPQHALAERLLRRPYFGAMLAFEITDGGREEVHRFFDALRLIKPVTTLGDVYTEALHPVMASHRSWSPAQLRRAGITPGLVRISAGIEDPDDLIADLAQALAQVAAPLPDTDESCAVF